MLYLLLTLTILAASFITGSFAAAVFSIIIIAIGYIYCKETRIGCSKDAQTVYFVTFVVVTILILVRVADIGISETNYENLFKTGGDEDGYFEKSQIAAKQSSFWAAVPNITNTLLTSYVGDPISFITSPGYHMYLGLVGYISNHLFYGNDIIVQLLGSCLFGCLLSVILFKILALYFPSHKARNYALIGIIFTAFMHYSASLLRDIHITFFFGLIFYIILQPFSIKNLTKAILIILLTASFRVWSALFMIVFISYYLYRRFNNKMVTVVFISLIALVFIFIMALPLIDDAMERLLIASRNFESKIVEESGYLQILNSFPTPIKETAIIASSFITPFTAWNELSLSDNLFHTIFKFTIVVYEFSWFLIIWLTVKWCTINKGLKKLPSLLLWLLIIVVAYFYVSTSEFTVRRTMCMYPLIYLAFVYLKEYAISKKQFKKDLYLPLAFYVLGVVLFVI